MKEKQWLAIGDAAGVDFNLVVGVTVGNEEINVAVVVTSKWDVIMVGAMATFIN